MTGARVARWVVAYLLAVLVTGVVVHRIVSLHPRSDGEVIASVWREGRLAFRATLEREDAGDPRLLTALAEPGGELVFERVVADGPVIAVSEVVLGASFVAGHDGVRATLGGQTVVLTPDDLLSAQVYDHGFRIEALSLSLGLDTPKLAALLGERLHAPSSDVLQRASLQRVRCVRGERALVRRITAETLSASDVRAALLAAAHHLARGVSDAGRFRYAILAPTNESLAGYDWPRHAGATFFLAQAWEVSREPELREAALRAAAGMTRGARGVCGGATCMGDEDVVALGSSALALLAYDQIVASGLEPGYRPMVVDVARFLRSQQRADGEFMHRFDRRTNQPIDVQGLYYSSEATLALARAYPITGDRQDLDAAARGLAHLVGPAWNFFGDRYYYGEEHWTCQALAALWPHAPDRRALDFCLGWQRYGRALQQRKGDSSFDADGAMGLGPVVTPRLTPVASRGEAAGATLEVAKLAGVDPAEIAVIDLQLRRALALLLRQQFRPGPAHLFRDPAAVHGAMPGSEVDWELRIDYAQHAGSAMVRWLQSQP